MTIETATYINQLNSALPGATDPKSEGDDHIRLLKSTVKATFPNVTGVVSATHTELGYVAGVTSAVQTQLNAKAPLDSPALTGTPTAPTAAAGTNTTQVATTAHVLAERSNTATLSNKTLNLADNTLVATSAQLAAAVTDETGTGALVFADSPALTGTPTAPTAAAGTNTTQLATTAFVQSTAFNTALPSQTGNAGKYVTTNGTTASWATPFTPSVTMTAAGTIAAGQPCIVTAAGTAAQVGVSGGGTTLTVANTLTGPGAGYAGAVFVDTPKAIVSFGNTRRDFIAGSYGINGVTWGTPVNALVNSPLVNVSFKALPNSSVFLIFYAANGTNFPTVLACSVSGTTITVGTPVTVESAAYANFSPSIAPINASTFALMWTNGAAAASSFNSCAGTVSGTTITLGSTTNTPTINAGNTSSAFKLVAQWDSNASRVVFMWGTFGGTQYFEYQTASISGTTLTYAAAANLYSGAGSGPVSGVDSSIYDTQRNQIVLITESTTLRSLSVAGAVVTSVATATGSGSLAYDSVDNLIIMNGANSNTVTNSGAALTVNANTTSINSSASICYDAGTNTIFAPGGTVVGAAKVGTTNLGTGNYVGIATNAASVGGTVTINTIGNTATITGLTPGSNYAVLNIGGLSPVTALTLGQYAGVAIGATTLLLKG